ncbi:hypothetical protein KIK06_25480 [Nocardiopsis sp. EMB25]|uniref:hypothetical protein n=1 Tax=Nocardiopsis sp. EMB25 TaxID=2835867 RepID=UPI0022833E1B|nr:hypothetical protein [Nocardiopsis sp. EMB25]MCY9787238.1 hypothetical protein [Nocardiopsis sp. EMB25]
MHHPNGRHRRPVESLAARLWQLAAAALATALTYVFTPQTPGPEPRAITPAPERPALTPAPSVEPDAPEPGPDPDEIGGALVRPYMLTRVPRPRLPVGDLLTGPAPGEFDELASLIRHYLDRSG